jgi:murein DD-endopeptidase MepM/ murein hydrolase activator NlpD
MKRAALVFVRSSALVLTVALASTARAADPPSYSPPGDLALNSGKGRVDSKVYAPDIRFPLEEGPAFANSQVFGHGGGSGPAGTDQCDVENFSYPWRDNFCETRDWSMPLCPAGTGHQGQDVRAPSCKKDTYWVVAITDGTITNVGSYSVYLTAADGTRYDYLHMSNVQVAEGDAVKRGQRVGKVSNQFGGSATTVHLHFNIRQNVAGLGSVFVPPYTSLIKAYETLLNPPPPPSAAPTETVAPPPEPPDAGAPDAPKPPDDTGCACSTTSRRGSDFGALAAVLGALGLAARRRRS